jgi:PAS domain S-box-containing protein
MRDRDARLTTADSKRARLLRLALPLALPVLALIGETALWSLFQSSVWFLFFPAVFLGSWVGGLRAAALAAAISIACVLWLLIPPHYSFTVPPGEYLAAALFLMTSLFFGWFHDRLRRANRDAIEALAESEHARAAAVRDALRRKQLERALRESHAQLDRGQSIAKVGSWTFDRRREALCWSAETYRILGVERGAPTTYEAFLSRVHPDDRAFVDRAWSAALGGAHYDIEHRIVVDGAIKWVRNQVELEFDEHHVPSGGVGITQDITDQKRYERQLREAQERLELALAGADLATWDWNLESDEVVFNPRWGEMRGLSLSEVSNRMDTWVETVHPDDLPRVRGALDEYFRGVRPIYEAEHRVRTQSGQWIWVLDRGKVFARGEHGQPIRMAGTELDITFRKRAEQELRAAEANAQFLAEVGQVLAYSLDLDSTMTRIGELAIRELADFSIIYLGGHDGTRRYRPVSRDPRRAWICDALSRSPIDRAASRGFWDELERTRGVVIRRVSPDEVAAMATNDEHRRAVLAMDTRSIVIAPLFAHGKLVGALSLFSSTPDREYSEAELGLVEQLAQRAAYAIDNAQLYAQARAAIDTRDNVLRIVAHDLRNPLGTMLMQAAVLRQSEVELEPRVAKVAASIERSAKRMNRLIQDLLDVARVEEGELSIEEARLSADRIVAESIDAQSPLARAAGIALHRDLAPDLPEVWADRDRLAQIFENLIGNAIKFERAGGTITVGAAPRDGDVLFWVADTGQGIAAADLPHVFDRFWQAQRSGGGAGLGLPIVKGLVEAHGGRIWAESTPGRGSIFFFTLPTASHAERSPSLPR